MKADTTHFLLCPLLSAICSVNGLNMRASRSHLCMADFFRARHYDNQ